MLDREITIFIAYVQEDERYVDKIKKILSSLKNRGYSICWYDMDVSPGAVVESENEKHLNSANIILLMISLDFLASKYGYGVQIKQAIQRHEQNLARVIPVVLRPSDIVGTPFSKLSSLPKNGKAISEWRRPDTAYRNISEGIRTTIEEICENGEKPPGNITQFRKPYKG